MLRKSRIKKVLYISGICTLAFVSMTACGKKKKISYGDTEGIVSGSVNITDDGAEIKLDNVIAQAGSDIDYTSAVTTTGEADDYSIEVNASNVRYDKPGTYTADYTIKSNGNTYTDSIKVTITDGGNKKTEPESGDKNTANNNSIDNQVNNAGNSNSGSGSVGNGSNENSSSGNGSAGNGSNGNSSSGNGSGGNGSVGSSSTGNGSSGSGSTGNSSTGGNKPNSGNSSTKPTTHKVLITDGSKDYGVSKIPNATIELLSGDVVTISCATNKYITSTRTDESVVERNGHKYKVTKLMVVFNTGAEQTLETIEKKMD